MLNIRPNIFRAATLATLFSSPLAPIRNNMSNIAPPTSQPSSSRWPTQSYAPRHSSWPYNPADFVRVDETPDTDFYGPPRFVNHIDDNAIATLRSYYADELPQRGKILDLCSSWVSHFPPELERLAVSGKVKRVDGDAAGVDQVIDGSLGYEGLDSLEVIGMGMNQAELSANPILSSSHLKDLNTDPTLPADISGLDATVCVVSIDYLTQPLSILRSILAASNPGAKVHLVLSNRCFPTKAIGRWLRISEEERTQMVGDYLWFSGWRDVEVVTLVKPSRRSWIGGGDDPLWVVRGKKVD